MRFRLMSAAMLVPIALAGCAQTPMGPTVAVMPANGKPFDVFQTDQAVCRQFAETQVGGGAQSVNNQQVGTALLGTVLGAGLGAAIGGGHGAAIGAASGALGGTAIGAGSASSGQLSLQQRYDIAYSQCMYSRGNQVPGFAPPPGYVASPPAGYTPYGQPGYPVR